MPPPRSYPNALLVCGPVVAGFSETCDRTRPMPASTYGCTGPANTPAVMLLIAVNTLLSAPGTDPKKFLAYAMSSSNPKMPLADMSDTPKLRCFSSQLVSAAQFAESPPKLYPRNGVTNPSALAGTAAPASAAITKATIL